MRGGLAAFIVVDLLSACGGGGDQPVALQNESLAPIVTLTANPDTALSGGSATLTWSSTNAIRCNASGSWSGARAPTGSEIISNLTATSTFTLACSGTNGASTQSSAIVTITTPPNSTLAPPPMAQPAPAPTVTLDANPATVIAGSKSKLSWNAANATACTASGAWTGAKPVSGSETTAQLDTSSTFILTCSGAGGTASQQVIVSVNIPPMVSLSAMPGTIANGGSATLFWSTTHAASCNGSGAWIGAKGTTGTASTGPLTSTSVFALSCTGPGGTAGQQVVVNVAAPPPPAITLAASPTTVLSGDSSMLSWTTSNATSCSASGAWSGAKPVGGTASTGPLNANSLFRLTCAGPGGSATQQVMLTVNTPPEVMLSASPSTIASGAMAELVWSSSNATSCTATGGWSGLRPPNGFESIGPLTNTSTFSLSCSGSGGSASQSTTITVDTPLTPSVTLNAANTTVASGDSVSLSWVSSHATSCTASGAWTGSKPPSGNESIGPLSTSGTYALTCVGAGGSATQALTITVVDPPTVSLNANPSSIASGNSTELVWTTSNATSCTASGGWNGIKPVTGSATSTALATTTTFTLTCSGLGGTASQDTTVTVTTPAPTIVLTANPTTVASGDSTTLTWSSTHATSCSASGAWNGSKDLGGSASSGALATTSTFTLSCTGPGGTASQQVTVTVNLPPTIDLNANPSTVANGASSTLSWSTTNATTCEAAGAWGGTKPPTGATVTGSLTQTSAFSLSCTGPGGTATQQVVVTVPPPAPTINLSASPMVVDRGSTATLMWSTTNANYCLASGAWLGSKAIAGTESTGVLLNASQFDLTCTGDGGSSSQSVSVAVNTPSAPVVTLSAQPTSILSGGVTVLTWTSADADTCVASGAWTGQRNTVGSEISGALTAASNTFTLSCTGPGGTTSASALVTVNASPSYTTNFELDEFPISEGGAWHRASNSFTSVRTENGIAHGTNGAADAYDDSYALLSGFGADQTAQAVIYRSPDLNEAVAHEVELLLRAADDDSGVRGYECLFAYYGGVQIIRWNGPLGDFTILDTTGPGGLGVGLQSGDVVKASIIGNVIRLYINGDFVAEAVDSTYVDGQPGISFFTRPGGNSAHFGFTSYTVSSN